MSMFFRSENDKSILNERRDWEIKCRIIFPDDLNNKINGGSNV